MKALVLIPVFLVEMVYGQFDSTTYRLAETIEAGTLKSHVYTLASPEFEGRETGTEGNRLAAEYISDQLASYRIPALASSNSYFQPVSFSNVKWASIEMSVNGETIEHLKDFLCIPQFFPPAPEALDISSMLFLGYGIDDPAYSDYKGVNVAGKHLIVYGGEPRKPDGTFRISGSASPSIWTIDPIQKVEAAHRAGAASIWIIEDKLREKVMNARRYLLLGEMLMGSLDELTADFIPNFSISSALGQKIIGDKVDKVIRLRDKITRKGKPTRLALPVNVSWKGIHDVKAINSANVLGYIEGTDPVLKKEIVVVSAHYDHLGKRGQDIFFGADDNASGTSAVLEIAQAMADAKAKGLGPKRSVLCMLMTGEEKGLLGSRYYTEYPVFPLENTVADVNIDMIGRVDEKHAHPNYTYVIGSDRLSTELHQINESVNTTYTRLDLDYTYNADDDPNRFYYRSDHYNFAKNGIPAIFYFSGVHDDYHRPTDTPDKIMFDKAATIAKLAFYTTWELANRKERIKVDVTGRS